MATLLTAHGLTKSYGTHTLFQDIAIGLSTDDRLGLIGPNGSGKSTLLKILAGELETDQGQITKRKQLMLAYVPQSDRFEAEATAQQCVRQHLKNQRDWEAHALDPDTRAAIALSQIGFDNTEQTVGTLSGGWRKRLSIACAIAREPDVLMLDEPTNHLDLEGVLWLEQFVKQVDMAVVCITHDRIFLENIANRIIELSSAYPKGSFEVKGNYSTFVERKEAFLNAQQSQQSAMASKVRRDTAWLRQGIQGRQTRNKTQVADTASRRDELKSLRDRNTATARSAGIDFQASDRQTRKLVEASGIAKSLGDKQLFEELDLILSPGMRLGLIGPNGSGKTTLMRVLTGDLEPDRGSVKAAEKLRVVNFTQHREALNPDDTLRDALCPVGDTVSFQGRSMHVSAWAKRFLFDPAKFSTSVKDLSGGEQARILIARLMLEPADVLLLDEPTNDLDIPTLEILEQSLADFAGAIVLVTHDRFMLARLSTQLLAFDGEGEARHHVSFEQWEAAQQNKAQASAPVSNSKERKPEQQNAPAQQDQPSGTKKLSYKLQREWDEIEQSILKAEEHLEAIQQRASNPSVMQDQAAYAEACVELGEAQSAVNRLYERWAELEAMTKA